MKIATVLITGVAGSGGSYLSEYLVKQQPNIAVHGIAHPRTQRQNLGFVKDQIHVHEADLLDFDSVKTLVEKIRPDAVFHLAAHANVRASFDKPDIFLNNNIISTSNLFEAIRLSEQNPVIQLCSTSEVYGQVNPSDVPIKEDCSLRPASPYAVSKVAQDLLGWAYFTSYKTKIIRTRMFTYLNPRRADLFASSFARQVARIEVGLQKELLHGNLDSVRTILDVRDAMEAYWLAVLKCEPGEAYNIGGTTTLKVGEFLDALVALSNADIPTRVDPSLLRPADVTLQIPCNDKFVSQTGWEPKVSFEESVANLLEYWRRETHNEVKSGPSSCSY